MKIHILTGAVSSVKKLKKFKHLRNSDLNPWPSLIMLILLLAVGVICVIMK